MYVARWAVPAWVMRHVGGGSVYRVKLVPDSYVVYLGPGVAVGPRLLTSEGEVVETLMSHFDGKSIAEVSQ